MLTYQQWGPVTIFWGKFTSTTIPPRIRLDGKKTNILCELDLWPTDLEMVHDTLSPHGLYLRPYEYDPWNRQRAAQQTWHVGQTDRQMDGQSETNIPPKGLMVLKHVFDNHLWWCQIFPVQLLNENIWMAVRMSFNLVQFIYSMNQTLPWLLVILSDLTNGITTVIMKYR